MRTRKEDLERQSTKFEEGGVGKKRSLSRVIEASWAAGGIGIRET